MFLWKIFIVIDILQLNFLLSLHNKKIPIYNNVWIPVIIPIIGHYSAWYVTIYLLLFVDWILCFKVVCLFVSQAPKEQHFLTSDCNQVLETCDPPRLHLETISLQPRKRLINEVVNRCGDWWPVNMRFGF